MVSKANMPIACITVFFNNKSIIRILGVRLFVTFCLITIRPKLALRKQNPSAFQLVLGCTVSIFAQLSFSLHVDLKF